METNGQQDTERVKVMLRNLGTVNKNEVTLENGSANLRLWFSYKTIVSFSANAEGFYDNATIQNYWSNTTGKLLDECEPDKAKRITQEEFNSRLSKAFKEVFK